MSAFKGTGTRSNSLRMMKPRPWAGQRQTSRTLPCCLASSSRSRFRLFAGAAILAVALGFTFQLPGAPVEPELEIRVIYDNTSARSDVQADWGFAAVVTVRGQRVLFDSGTKPELFLTNLEKMQVDPSSIAQAVISHQHPDHRNGIYKLFPLHPSIRIHFLKAFYEKAYEEATAVGMTPNRVTGPFEVEPGVYSTGMIAGDPPEQSLAVETSKGIVLLVGCGHPGVVNIVETVEKQRGADSIRLVLGGFHMLRQNEDEINSQIAKLKRLNVHRVMPAHCSGDLAKRLFRDAYGENFETLGAGKVLRFD